MKTHDAINGRATLRYWRQCLADSERMNVEAARLQDAYKVDTLDLRFGQVDEGLAVEVHEAYEKIERRPAKRTVVIPGVTPQADARHDEDVSAPLLICPVLARPEREHGINFAGKEKPLTPLWIPAVVFRGGRLAPSSELFPWIARNLLEPVHEASMSIGTVEDLDRFLTLQPSPINAEDPELPPRWIDLWNYSERMMRAVTGYGVDDFVVEATSQSRPHTCSSIRRCKAPRSTSPGSTTTSTAA